MPSSYAVLLTLLSAFSAFAQLGSTNPGQAGQPVPTFRSDTNLVTIRFQMTPKKGQTADLRPEDIELREDGVPVKVSAFQGGQLYPPSIPVEVNLLFDDLRPPSGTTVPRWLQSAMLDLASADDHGLVSVAVWAFSGDLVRLTPPTRDAATLNHAIEGLWGAWATSLHDGNLLSAVETLVNAASGGRTNVFRMIVVVSASGEVFGYEKDLKAIQETGVAVFPVIVGGHAGTARVDSSVGSHGLDKDRPTQGGYQRATGGDAIDMQILAQRTGGKLLALNFANNNDSFRQIFQWLGEQIRSDYLAGFYAPSPGQPKPHKIEIVLKDSKRGKLAGSAQTLVY
jgi:VWFA-related protein